MEAHKVNLKEQPSVANISTVASRSTNEAIILGPDIQLGDHLVDPPIPYKLYKRRFAGCFAMALLSAATATSGPWFGPIANDMSKEFGFTLDQINWLGVVIGCVYLPTALILPVFCRRFGIRRCCEVGALALLFSSWIRYAGTARSLSEKGSYALLMLSQIIVGLAHPIFQVLGPKYSELWFGLTGRTTSTTIIAISFPVGGAVSQIISPLAGDTRRSILIQGIICTVVTPAVFLIGEAPPIPPTYAGAQKSPSLLSLFRAMVGKKTSPGTQMTPRERLDFAVITIIFAVFVATLNTFGLLTAQNFSPYGYSPAICGALGATMLLTGIVGAIITAPIFDRVLTHHLGITIRILVPIVGAAWLSLIWAARPHNIAPLFVIVTVLGVGSIILLPIALELSCEVTRNADGSSAILWFFANVLGIVFPIIEGALRAGPDAQPPKNMHKALIFSGSIAMSSAVVIYLVQGRQVRRELDEQKNKAQEAMRIDKLPKSITVVGEHTTKSQQKFRSLTSTESFQTLNSFHARNVVAGGGITL